MMTDGGIPVYPVHHCQAVYFRHNNIQQNYIRLLFPDNLAKCLSVPCFAHNLQVLILTDDMFKKRHHSLIIIRDCHI